MKSPNIKTQVRQPGWPSLSSALFLGAALLMPARMFANTSETEVVADASGTSSIIGTTNWSPTTIVSPTNTLAATYDYATATTLRTPVNIVGYPNNYQVYADAITMNTGGTLAFKGSNVLYIPNLVLNGGTVQEAGTGGSPDVARLAGGINLTANSTLKLAATTANTLNILSTITNGPGVSATLTANTGGFVLLSAQNTYNGNFTVANTAPSTILQLGTNNALPPTAILNLNGGGNAGNATLDLNGFGTVISNLIYSTGLNTGIVTNSAFGTVGTLTIGYNTPSNFVTTLSSGEIMDNPTVGGTVALTKIGNGTLLMGIAYPYSGDTTIGSGTNKMGASNLLPNGPGRGNYILDAGATLDLAGRQETVNGLSGNGTIDTSGGVAAGNYVLTVGSNNISSTFGGIFQNTISAAYTGLAKVGSGTLTLLGTNTYNGTTTVTGGRLALGATGSIAGSSTITVRSGAVLDVSAVTGGWTLGASQTLAGSGSVNGNVGLDGTLLPGPVSIGALTFSNNLVLGSGSVTTLQLNRTNSPAADSLVIGGSLAKGGVLTITNAGDPLQAGDTFTLLSAASSSGTFSTVNLPVLTSGLSFNTSLLNSAGVISVAAAQASQPGLTGITLSGSSLVINGTNGTPGQSFSVLTTTDLTQPFASWVLVATNTFSGGSFSVTNPVNPNLPQSFFILRVP